MSRVESPSAQDLVNRAKKQSSTVRTVASSSNGAWRYVTCSSSMLIVDDDADALAREPTVKHVDEQPELTCTSSGGYSDLRPLPVPPTNSIFDPNSTVAISSTSSVDNYLRNCQDVRSPVNNSASASSTSTATRLSGSSVLPIERKLSSHSSNPHGSLNSPSNRPRTFISTADLANHYGIPTILPPAPRTTPRRPSVIESPPAEYPDFASLSSNYLNMLNSKTQDNTTAPEPTSPSMGTLNPAELSSPVQPTLTETELQLQQLFMLAGIPPTPNTSPAMPPPSPDFDEFLTSASPFTPYTPFEDDLSTPLFADSDMLTAPLISDFDNDHMALFGGMDFETEPTPTDTNKVGSSAPALPDTSNWFTMSPATPSLDVHDRSAYPSPALDSSAKPVPRRKSTATGTRKNITPEALVPYDAPTQPRKYTTPSATSRKEVPVTFARKRARSQAFNDDDDEQLEDAPGPNATEKEQIEWKRRQNTLAARKSRKRKLEHQQYLEDQVQALTSDRDKWKTRALTLQNMLHSHGIPFTQFDD